MKKLGILFATILMMMLFAMSVSAIEIVKTGNCGDDGDNVTYVLYDNGKLVVSGEGKISDYAFSNNKDIKTVIIEDGITDIGVDAFSQSSVTNIVFGKDITWIEFGAFQCCDALRIVSIPNNLTSIGEAVFWDCDNLTDLYIGNGVKYISDNAISCPKLTNVYFGKNVETIGSCTFSGSPNISVVHYAGSEADWKQIYSYDDDRILSSAELHSADKYDFTTLVTNPTCSTLGYTTYTCECGQSFFADYVDTTEHSYTLKVSIPATHLADGVELYVCDCGDVYTKYIPKFTEHTYTIKTIIEPTHLEEGVKTFSCYCGNIYTEILPKLVDHTYTSDITTEPTHFKEGVKTYTCPCGDSYTESVPKLEAHTYNTITIDPTCTDRGHKIYTCPCGDSYTDTLPAKGHTFSGSVCTTCGYDKADDCTCNCHKTGIANFFWKIANFFNKLFKIKNKQMCACGVVHY